MSCADALPKPHSTLLLLRGNVLPKRAAAPHSSDGSPGTELLQPPWGWLPSPEQRHSKMVVPRTRPSYCISDGGGSRSATREDFITQIQAILRLLVTAVCMGDN